MTDRELLELAAKAAGISVIWSDITECFWLNSDEDSWNPLTDDGDALRLAVKLEINVWVDGDIVWCNRTTYQNDKADPYAATRRAIVRAAAEIGRNMK